MIETKLLFYEKWNIPPKFLWTRRMKFDNLAGISSTKDQIFLLHAQE